MSYGIILFHSKTVVMAAEKLLTSEGYSISLMPTPRQITSDCALGLRFSWSQNDAIKAILAKANIEIQGTQQLPG